MRDIYSDVDRWFKDGQQVVLSTVIKTWGSSPRTTGAKMAVNQDGGITGSVSGGCVEGAVVTASIDTLKHAKAQFLHFDVADETAWEVGVACGGEVDIFVRKMTQDVMEAFQRGHNSDEVFALATVVQGPDSLFGREISCFPDGSRIGSVAPELDDEIVQLVAQELSGKTPQHFQLREDIQLFIDVMPPPPTLVIVGGVHIAVALTRIAKAAGFRVIVVDPRRQFGTQVRFPEADEIIRKWPDEAFEEIKLNHNTAVAMLTHDPKIDDPGLLSALPSDVYYVGALGSQKTQAARRERLLAAGLDPKLLERLHGPIGLDLGGRSPEEIALAVMAEVVQKRYQS
jgi:xanthine dehydrogenase accessory factor